ncbi:MAG: sigma-70 family RNA polymerase sigma factor [Clostridia bacterium]|nr:sigma-70 family RNA polymerase sigma factor [Clostridia bacterium]
MDNAKFIKTVNKLIVKIAQGDSRALEMLFDLTKKTLLYVAKTYLSDKNKAEDVLSETYLKVVNNAKSFDKCKNGYNWLYEITKNTALNENRKDKNFSVTALEDNVPYYECFDGLINRVAVQNAISELLPEERRLIYEYFFEKKTVQEIADRLHISKSSAHERITVILKQLKKFLI